MLSSLILRIMSAVVLAVFPATVFAAESNVAAMLYGQGGTTLNGNGVSNSSAVFPGDLVQTDDHSVANINASGSVVLVHPESSVQYLGDGITLKKGAMRVSTSRPLVTRAGDVSVSPADSVLTNFEIRDVDGRVQIAAHKGNLLISDSRGTTQLAQGQETTRDDSQPQTTDEKKKKKKSAAAAPATSSGAILNSPIAIGIAAAGVAGLATWVFLQGENAVSPVK